MATLEELLAQIQAQPGPSTDAANIAQGLGAGLNVLGAITGRGAIGQPLAQFGGQLANQALQQQRQQQNLMFDLANFQQREKREKRLEKTESRRAAQEQRAATKRKQAEQFQSMIGDPTSNIYNAFDEETRFILQSIDPDTAVKTAVALQRGKVAGKRAQEAADKARKFRQVLEVKRQQLKTQDLSQFERAQKRIADGQDAKTAFLAEGYTPKQVESLVEDSDIASSIGLNEPGFWRSVGEWIGIVKPSEEDPNAPLQKQVKAAQQRQTAAQQQFLGGQQQPDPALQQRAIQLLQQQGRAVTPESIAIVIQRLQQQVQ